MPSSDPIYRALRDPDRPTWESYFSRLAFWAYPSPVSYDIAARPWFLLCCLLLIAPALFLRLMLLGVAAVVILNYIDTRFALFPYRPRSRWSARQEAAYRRLLGTLPR